VLAMAGGASRRIEVDAHPARTSWIISSPRLPPTQNARGAFGMQMVAVNYP
jgi:hypothetical protein